MATRQAEMLGEYVTIKGASQATGRTYWTIYRAIQRRNLPTVKLGRTVMVKLADIRLALLTI